ncbi:hypothetical protein BT93_F3416 [Corymbia citriodora subsp. variegata]|nr:hypothetical protein BT93_F3416 [Corymbia citriodora subsp. variegata]
MAGPTIALYASPPSGVCSAAHQINAHVSYDLELNSRSSQATSSATSSSSSSSQKIVGGLSCLFSTPCVKQASGSSFSGGEELGQLWPDRSDEFREFSSSFRHSPSKFMGSLKRDHQSPVSVLQGPVLCGNGSIKSPPTRISREVRGGSRVMYDGFVRNAMGSCVDYDPNTFELRDAVGVEELPFNLEENSLELDTEPYVKELLVGAQSRHKIFCEDFVVKAFYEAEKAHRGQMRASGDPYLQHCVETAVLLARIGANSTMVAAGLLHDTLDDSHMTYDNLCRNFGSSVADLVEGVSKLSQLSKLARESNTASKTAEADRLHTTFLAMADARAVLIKLADRLHNMMTLDALPLVKQQRFAKETLEIFAPLTNRLGISSWKEELENLCFKHLNPDRHKELSSQLLESYDETIIASAKAKLEQALENQSISYHDLYGRHKSLYSIHCKMLKKNLTMDNIHDVHGLRLIVEKKEDCYRALGIVHQLWSEIPGKFKDYITHPKFNGYQSLHTVVMGNGMIPLEVQIRTKEMHLQAEFGFAAHWRYKEGECKHSSSVLQMVEWARWVITWHCETMSKDHSSIGYSHSFNPPCKFPCHSDDCPYSYKPHNDHSGPIFVIVIENEKMSVQEYQADSTMMDLLERAGRGSARWMPYGFPLKEKLRLRLNRQPIGDPTCKLRMGDVVELMPALPNKSLTDYREEIQRMYNRGPTVSSTGPAASTVVGWRN